jgi:RNA polymerase sigma-70 factor (ECF subfamily)
MQRFLAAIEGRAFRIAQFATRNRDDALDLVQEAMMKLVQKYAERDESEWSALFYTILQSRIRDWHRRQSVRNRFRHWFNYDEEDDEEDMLQQLPAEVTSDPAIQLGNEQFLTQLDIELGALPYRQQQVFLLRVWEGLDVAETAEVMACSESAVKTHYARALEKLRGKLEGMR